MQNIPEIQIWNSFDSIDIHSSPLENGILIEIQDSAKTLPEELEKAIDGNWKKSIEEKELVDNQILYLSMPIECKHPSGKIIIPTNARGFKYNQAFNRNPDFHVRVDELNKYKLLSISTLCYLITKDDKLLFGTKINQNNQKKLVSN